jgi:hypothetical protein
LTTSPPDPTDTLFAFQHSFLTQAALDAAFVAGVYTFQISTVHDGYRLVPLTLASDSFPVAPHITNWAATQNINPAADFSLAWDPFSSATALDDIVLSVSDSVGNSLVFANLVSTATSFDLPAGTFQSGQSYQVTLQFRHFVSQDTTNYPGVTGSVRFVSRTVVNLATAASSTAPLLAVVTTNGSSLVQLRLTGQAGGLYAIDASTNLQGGPWLPLVTNTAVADQFLFADPQSANLSLRFYRGRAAN